MIAPAGSFVAGSIVSSVVLDDSKFQSTTKNVNKSTQKMGIGAKAASGQFRGMGTAMTVAGGAILASLGAMISKFAKAGDEVHKMAKRTGFSTKRLSELSYAAQIAGTDIGSLEKGVKKMAKTIIDANDGLKTYQRAFDRIGVSYQELATQSPEEQFNAIAKAIADIEDPTIRAATAQEIFGRAGTQLLPLFAEGSAGMEELAKKAHDLGIVFDQDAANGAAALVDAQTTLKESLNGLAITFAQNIVPALADFIDKVSSAISGITDWAKKHPALTSIILKFAGALGGVMTVFGPMLIILPKLISGFKLMRIALGGVGAKLGVVGAIGASAFVGWQVGRLIGEITGLDQVIQNHITTHIDFWQKLFKVNQEIEVGAGHAAALAKQQVLLAEASKMVGYEVTSVNDAMKILKGESEKVAERFKTQEKGTSDLEQQINDLMKTTENATASQKTWTEYLDEKGILTISQTKEKTNELEKILRDLSKAYNDGLISLGNYENAVRLVKEEQMAMGTIIETELQPTLLNTNLILDQATAKMEGQELDTSKLPAKVSQMTTNTTSLWKTFTDGLRTKWTTAFSDMLQGTTSFKEGMKGLFDSIRTMFFDMISQMVTKWIIDFVGNIISGSVKAGTAIVENVASSISNVAKGVKNVADTVASALTGGLATAIGAAVGSFFGALVSGGSEKFLLTGIKDNTWTTAQHGQNTVANLERIYYSISNVVPILDVIKIATWNANKKRAGIHRSINVIADNTKEIADNLADLPSAQGGMIAKTPTLAIVGDLPGNVPEIVAPLPDLQKIGGKSVQVNLDMRIAFQFDNQIDPNFTQRHVRKDVIPGILTSLESNEFKSRFLAALGLA